MDGKIDTREKFVVVTPNSPVLSANIAANLIELCTNQLEQPVRNIILNLSNAQSIEPDAALGLARIQQMAYENNASFVICCLQPAVETLLDSSELLETLNITPTESEAWDIVQ
ncbi:MAG TPA: STAS domain-containing protein, partial [Sediminibacterium sp.]|nr:STAS domain-containing protein [Sediminibacterium sp.]